MKIKGKLKIISPINGSFGHIYPANVFLNAIIDEKSRIFIEHPDDIHSHVSVNPLNILESEWDKEPETKTNKPRFYQAVLILMNEKTLNEKLKGQTIAERMENPNGECPECGKNEWWLLPKESAAVREGGKPYCECLNCGYQTHL